eukprot:1158044-Pelagomonas_calceolata.AAC.3
MQATHTELLRALENNRAIPGAPQIDGMDPASLQFQAQPTLPTTHARDTCPGRLQQSLQYQQQQLLCGTAPGIIMAPVQQQDQCRQHQEQQQQQQALPTPLVDMDTPRVTDRPSALLLGHAQEHHQLHNAATPAQHAPATATSTVEYPLCCSVGGGPEDGGGVVNAMRAQGVVTPTQHAMGESTAGASAGLAAFTAPVPHVSSLHSVRDNGGWGDTAASPGFRTVRMPACGGASINGGPVCSGGGPAFGNPVHADCGNGDHSCSGSQENGRHNNKCIEGVNCGQAKQKRVLRKRGRIEEVGADNGALVSGGDGVEGCQHEGPKGMAAGNGPGEEPGGGEENGVKREGRGRQRKQQRLCEGR